MAMEGELSTRNAGSAEPLAIPRKSTREKRLLHPRCLLNARRRSRNAGAWVSGRGTWVAGSRIRLLDGRCRLLAQLCPGTGSGRSLRDGFVQEALADTPGGRVPGPELCEMKDSGPEWLVEVAGVEKPGTACSGHTAVSQSVNIPQSVPQRTHGQENLGRHPGHPSPRRSRGLASCPDSTPRGLGCAPGPKPGHLGERFWRLVLSTSSSDIATQRESLRGREGGGSGISEHQLCA